MHIELSDIKNSNIPLLYEQAFLHFINFKNLLYYFPTRAPKENNGVPVPIYRSRIHSSEKYITDIDELSYRPAKDVLVFGRVNRPCQSYFYASGEANTCYDELENRINEELRTKNEIALTTGQWTLKRDLTLCVIPDWNNPNLIQFVQNIESFKNLSQININLLRGINKLFLSEDENSNIYQVSSAFCNAILYYAIRQKVNIDGFLYTSVKNGRGYNLALFPKIINDEEIILTNVVKTYFSRNIKSYFNEAKNVDMKTKKIVWEKSS